MATRKKGAKRKSSKRRTSAARQESAGQLLGSLELDTRHTNVEPLLRKMAEGEASEKDVNTAVDNDSRLEPLRDVLTKIAAGTKVSQEEIDAAVDSKNEPIKPVIEALNKG